MSMFCFQCEQTARCTGCTVSGVCGKNEKTANLQDKLTGHLIGLARACCGSEPSDSSYKALIDGLFMTLTNVSFDDEAIEKQMEIILEEKAKLVSNCGAGGAPNDAYDMNRIWEADEDTRSLKSLVLFGLRGMAAYAYHGWMLGKTSLKVNRFLVKGLASLVEDLPGEDFLALAMKLGTVNLACMELLDEANTGSYGVPFPARVTCNVEPGPFIVVTGHDLHDLKLLLEQTEGKGVNIYTHGEMLPAHGYPELRKYSHLKGNFGAAWQNQQNEFDSIPAPVLFTANCLMPPRASYADRVFTTAVVGYPGMEHIGEDKDFSVVIEKALALGGYSRKRKMTGVNGGDTLTTGFGHGAVLSVADKVIEAVKGGKIRHFFLVGGCDGARAGRNYYTDFVKLAPADTVALTLACGKYRFNDMDLGDIGGLPRLMDMGQCNDAYGAIKVAEALGEALGCSVNELPLTLTLSWYEQKAVCILLSLLSLGIKNIYIGPTLPAFISPNILKVLSEKWGLRPVSTPEEDLKKILE